MLMDLKIKKAKSSKSLNSKNTEEETYNLMDLTD